MLETAKAKAPVVRRAMGGDVAPVLAARAALAIAGVPCAGIPDDWETVRELLEDSAMVIMYARWDDRPAGLAHLVREDDGRVRIALLGVAPEYRRRGAGAALLTNGLFAALPASAIYLQAPATDHAALAWARERAFRSPSNNASAAPAGYVELELRLDAPAEGCGAAGHGCGAEGCACGGH